jgi:hypothetical protein
MPTLKQGSSGPDVKDLQQRLKDLGFDPNGVDGNFGPGTTKAVIAFQQSKGLGADGKAGPNTLAALQLGGTAPGDADSGAATATAPALAAAIDIVNTDAAGRKLNDDDISKAAQELNCDVATIKAVCEVEAAGAGFDDSNRLKLRFEGHKFRNWTDRAYDQSHPDLSYSYGVQKTKKHGYSAFVAAMALDPEAAMKSTSWGLFQPMGEYFKECGFNSAEELVKSYTESEGNQLLGFVKQIKSRGLDGKLRKRDWAGFAANYNGGDFASNKYDTKLAAAHAKYSK